jgi:hypothetical protein
MKTQSVPSRLLTAFAALACATTAGFAADTQPDAAAAANAAAESRIHIKYTTYISDVLNYADTVLDEIASATKRTDAFAAKTADSPPSWSFSRDSFEKLGQFITRVPNWFPKDDLALFRSNIDLLKSNTAELLKLSNELRTYFGRDGAYKTDSGKQYAALKPKLDKLTADAVKARDAIRKRSIELADAAESSLAAVTPLGAFLLALRDDLARVNAINAALTAAEAAKTDPAAAKAVAEKIAPLLKAFKESAAKNATRSHRELAESRLETRDRFYTDSAAFVKYIEETLLAGAKTKGTFSDSNYSSLRGLHGNVVSSYNKFVVSYNYYLQRRIAIER